MRVLQVDSGREWRGGQQQVLLLCRELSRNAPSNKSRHQQGGRASAGRADGITVQGVAWEIGLDRGRGGSCGARSRISAGYHPCA